MELQHMSKQALEDGERWFGDGNTPFSIPHMTLGMCGEVGEFANLVKKIERGDLRLGDAGTRLRLAEELTDVFTYLINLAGLLGIDLEKSYQHVRSQNEKRFMAMRKDREAQQ